MIKSSQAICLKPEEVLVTHSARCPEHGEPWEYFCRQHKTCLCSLCLGTHQSHNLQKLEKAVAEGRATLAQEVHRIEQAQKHLQDVVVWLQDAQEQIRADRCKLKEQVLGFFSRIREIIAAEERSVLSQIEVEEDLESSRLKNHISEMQSKREASLKLFVEVQELENGNKPEWEFMSMFHKTLEKLLRVDVQLQNFVVQKRELEKALLRETRKDVEILAKRMCKIIQDKVGQHQEVLLKWKTPVKAPLHIVESKGVKIGTGIQWARLTLDPNTVHCNVTLSSDLLSAQWVKDRQPHPAHVERFRLHPQVLCSQGFFSGHHRWEVALRGLRRWEVGATCKSRDMLWVDSCISWALRWDGWRLQAFEGNSAQSNNALSAMRKSPDRIIVTLDCEGGTLSFFNIQNGSAPAEGAKLLLHTFNIKPQGPVFPGFYLEQAEVSILQHDTNGDLSR